MMKQWLMPPLRAQAGFARRPPRPSVRRCAGCPSSGPPPGLRAPAPPRGRRRPRCAARRRSPARRCRCRAAPPPPRCAHAVRPGWARSAPPSPRRPRREGTLVAGVRDRGRASAQTIGSARSDDRTSRACVPHRVVSDPCQVPFQIDSFEPDIDWRERYHRKIVRAMAADIGDLVPGDSGHACRIGTTPSPPASPRPGSRFHRRFPVRSADHRDDGQTDRGSILAATAATLVPGAIAKDAGRQEKQAEVRKIAQDTLARVYKLQPGARTAAQNSA